MGSVFECYYYYSFLITVTIPIASLLFVCLYTLRGQLVKAWCVHTVPWPTAVFTFCGKDYTNISIV